MFNIAIPSKQSKKYSVTNNGDLFGNLIATRNLDFNKKGYLSLAGKPFAIFTQAQDSDFNTNVFIASDNSNYFVCTTGHLFTFSPSSFPISASEPFGGTPPSFGFRSDYAFFTADIHVSGTTTVNSLNGSTWTSRITGLSTTYPHPMCVSEHQSYLAVGNGNSVRLYDAAYALITTCTIPSSQVVTWIRWRGNLLYFGTRNITGGEGKMYVWNGSGTAANAGYGVGSSWAMSGCEYLDTIAVASQDGRLLRFTGAGFVSLSNNDGTPANFPIYNTGLSWSNSASTSNLMANIASRGMEAKGDKIFMFVDASIGFTYGQTPNYLPNFPTGLYVFDPSVGLYHKGAADHQKHQEIVPSALSSNTLTLPSALVYETGDPVIAVAGGLTGDIVDGTLYYAIKVDSTHMKLALTPQQAVAGANITITGSVVGSYILANSYKSVGATKSISTRSGPVKVVGYLGLPKFIGTEVLFSSSSANNTGTTVSSFMGLGMGKNVGSFITPKIQAENVTDIFKKLIVKFPPLNISSRKILIKYRTANRWGSPGRGDIFNFHAIWTSSTTFTINPNQYDVYSLAVGDEIEITGGAAAGYTAHVTTITQNSSTLWTITIDETMPDVTASDTMDFVFDNWTKYKTISTTDDAQAAAKGFKNAALTKNAKWAQLKIELRGYADIDDTMDFEEVMLVTGADQKYA